MLAAKFFHKITYELQSVYCIITRLKQYFIKIPLFFQNVTLNQDFEMLKGNKNWNMCIMIINNTNLSCKHLYFIKLEIKANGRRT